MRSVFDFIVRPYNKRNTAEKDIDGKKLLLNTELQNHQYVSRHGVVVSTPLAGDYNIKEGDEVILHHNVFRRFRDVRGNEKNSKSYYKEDLFFAQPDQIYAYKRDTTWKPVDGFVFVSPVVNEDMFAEDKEKQAIGIVVYAEDYEPGEIVGFRPGMEYEFNIAGMRLYRIPGNQITIKYGDQGNQKEYHTSWSQGS